MKRLVLSGLSILALTGFAASTAGAIPQQLVNQENTGQYSRTYGPTHFNDGQYSRTYGPTHFNDGQYSRTYGPTHFNDGQ